MWAEKLPSGKYRAVWRDGSGRQTSKAGFGSKPAALRYAGEQEGRSRRGEIVRAGRSLTWEDWHRTWLDLRLVEASTARNDASTIKGYLLPYWGSWRLNKITRTDVQGWVNGLVRGGTLSPSSIRRHFYVFSGSLLSATPAHIPYNPCTGVSLPALMPGKEHYLEPGQLERALDRLDEPYRAAMLLLASTGMRFGEMAGLHWERVDLSARVIMVAESWSLDARMIKGYPKDQEPRPVPIPAMLVGALAEMREAAPAAMTGTCGVPHVKGSRCRSKLVLTADGAPLNRDRVRYRWYRAVADAGLAHTRQHDLRHSYASWLRTLGVELEVVQELLGHRDITTTRRYSHIGSPRISVVADALDKSLPTQPKALSAPEDKI